MWIIYEEDKVLLAFAKKEFLKYTLMCFCFVLMIM